MKKNYFENNESTWQAIVPFDKVVAIRITPKTILVFDVTSEKNGIEFPVEQLEDYKEWLALKQQALENSACSGPTITGYNEELAENLKKYWKDCEIGVLKPEITEELLLFLYVEYDFCPCTLCKKDDERVGTICKLCKFIINKEEVLKLNRKWQDSK